jgi:hypothetical protein
MRRVFFILLYTSLLSPLPACDDDPTGTGGSGGYTHTSLSGQVTIASESVPVAGAKVALVEPLPYRVVDGPVTSDAQGRFQFENPPVGDWFLFVFGDSVLMFNTGDARVSVRRGQRIEHNIEMIRSALWGTSWRRIVGRVTDAQTGDPVEGAYVSGLFPNVWPNFVGISIDSEDITDADGRYEVAPVQWFTGSSIFYPLGVARDGYAPFHVMDLPLDADPDSLYVLDVALERAGDGATVRGRVVDPAGKPLANLPVALDYSGIPIDTLLGNGPVKGDDDPGNVPLLGSTARTHPDGTFEIRDLIPGTYWLDAAFLPDDGYVGGWDDSALFEIAGTEVLDLGDVYVLPALLPLAPANGATVSDSRPVLRWEAVPGADRYELHAGPGHYLNFERDITGVTEFEFDFDLPPGTRFRWTIQAFRTATPFDEVVAQFEAVQAFTVAE